jgi:hypothetical protein
VSAKDELLDYARELIAERPADPLMLSDPEWAVDQTKYLIREHAEAIETLDKRVRHLEDGRQALLQKIIATLADMG